MAFDHGLFNIEFIYNSMKDSVHIIEINPRMASQFADLYEKVDGTNSYEILLDLALGKKPVAKRGQGRHRMAASCALRTFENAMVVGVPRPNEIERLQRSYPDARIEILASEGGRLSQEMQDGASYRYGIISIGGRDRQDILSILDHCTRELDFVFETVEETVE